MRNSFLRGRNGFTIIEMVVTIGVGGLFLMGAYSLMLGAIRSAQQARNRTAASNQATLKIEELRGLSYSNVPICPNDPPTIPPDPVACRSTVVWPPAGGIPYTIDIFSSEITTTFPPPSTDKSQRKDIRITVRWNDPKAQKFVTETTITPSTANRTPQ